jgi:hypothetical protein
LSSLPGVGPRVAEKLATRGLLTLQDLWLTCRGNTRTAPSITPFGHLAAGVAAQVEAWWRAVRTRLPLSAIVARGDRRRVAPPRSCCASSFP